MSGEHEVSLLSASSVVRNVNTSKHSLILIGITKTGSWFLQDNKQIEKIRTDKSAILRVEKTDQQGSILPGGKRDRAFICISSCGTSYITCDIVFPVLHGTFGEDGTVQGLFEMAQVPYVGCGVMSSSLTMDKEKTKQVWLSENLPAVPFVCIKKGDILNDTDKNKLLQNAEQQFGYPLFVKPCCAGSSVGASKAGDRASLEKSLTEAFLWDEKILIEPFISAREIECSVTGNYEPKAYVPGEVIPRHEFYDYEAKYIDPEGAALLIPAKLTKEETVKIKDIAIKAYKAVDASGLSRIDFFLDKKTGEMLLNEINTIPGFTSISMFSKMCEAEGLTYPELIEHLFALALDRFKNRNMLKTSR